jgi:hypothetical protein
MLCEKNMTTTKARSALSVPWNTKHVAPTKHKIIQGRCHTPSNILPLYLSFIRRRRYNILATRMLFHW